MGKLVARNDKIAFFGVKNGETETFQRMTNFTALAISKNPKEYTRRYVDEVYDQTDVTAYSPSIAFTFDQYTTNGVHSDIASISDEEKVGIDAIRNIILVDLNSDGTTAGTKKAVKRAFAVVPDTEGGTDSYTIGGNFKTKGRAIAGTVATTDDWMTITFTAS